MNRPAELGIKERKYLMSKKLITACMALFALAAFALPAVASASPVATHPTGTKMAVHANAAKTCAEEPAGCIKATNIGETLIRDTANANTLVRCTTASMTGTLVENSGTSIKGNISSTAFTGTGSEGRCTDSFGAAAFVDTNIGNGTPWCLQSGASDTFTVRGNSCANESRSITFVLTDSVVGTCKYSRATAVSGTFTTHSTGDAILTVAPSTTNSAFAKEEGSVLCPASGLLEMKFTLETDTATAEPLYIS
jgi:hypothetical protein